jgi:hypothetical protein
VLGIRNAPPELARRLVAQALVVEAREDEWRRIGDRLRETAPDAPGVSCCATSRGGPFRGKAVKLRRRLRAHFARRRWVALKAAMARVVDAEWRIRIRARSPRSRSRADPRAAAAGQRADRTTCSRRARFRARSSAT